ncbi:MAG: transglutaminase domain-containing protein [Methanomicrobiales archaeon]|nr:transglutaminase domain-containing protein [Methanomicrobiales archaeon]MDI6877451.1 transglutaminase domain-containing protein [Methanomicrobiales archaeon]
MGDDEYRFIVQGTERIVIDGTIYEIENAEHIFVGGKEYILIGNDYYELNRNTEYQIEEYQEGGNLFAKIGKVLLILCIIAVVYHAFTIDFVDSSPKGQISSTSSGASISNTQIAPKVTTSAPTVTAAPDTSIQSRATQVAEAMDYTNPTTRDFALTLIDPSHGGEYNIAQICDMWERIYRDWTYVNDPKGSLYYSPASRTINIGLKGDCDDFAIVTASVVMAIGGSARVVLAYNTDSAGHAYAEVYLGSTKDKVQSAANYICKRYRCTSIAYHTSYKKDGTPMYWLNLDWSAKHPGGPFYKNDGETYVVYPNKYWERVQ